MFLLIVQFCFASTHYIFKFHITWRCRFRKLSGMTIEDDRPERVTEHVVDESDGEEEEDEEEPGDEAAADEKSARKPHDGLDDDKHANLRNLTLNTFDTLHQVDFPNTTEECDPEFVVLLLKYLNHCASFLAVHQKAFDKFRDRVDKEITSHTYEFDGVSHNMTSARRCAPAVYVYQFIMLHKYDLS